MNLLKFLRPAPHAQEIGDSQIVSKKYRYWRIRTFYSMYIGYAFYYFTRKSFTAAMPLLQADLGLEKFELGLIASILSLTYGASKFLSGILGDRSNPRYFMSIGLILTGIFNLFFGMSSTLWTFAVFWGLNGWFQGWGWPGCAKLLTSWYSQSERGRWWSVWNTSHNLGAAVIPILVALCAQQLGWRSAMHVPGILCILGGLFLMNRLRDTPQSLGLPPIEKFRDDYPSDSARQTTEAELTGKQILMQYVLKNKFIWVLAAASFFIYAIRTAVNDWSMLYLMETKGYSLIDSSMCVFCFEAGGFCGSLSAGWISDVIFRGKRNPVNVLFSAAIILPALGFQAFTAYNQILDGLFLFLLGFFIFGPQMMIGISAAELSHKRAAATATGFTGCFAYLGAAAAGAPLGAIIKSAGWHDYLLVLSSSALVSALLLLPLWSVKAGPQEIAVEPQTDRSV